MQLCVKHAFLGGCLDTRMCVLIVTSVNVMRTGICAREPGCVCACVCACLYQNLINELACVQALISVCASLCTNII